MKNYFFFFVLLVCIKSKAQDLQILRGPYLNMATQSSIILRLKTNVSGQVIINYGENPSVKNLSISKSSDNQTYVFEIKDLKPETKYYYEINSKSKVLLKGDSLYFKTQPLPDSKQKLRFIAYGDCGTQTPEQKKVAMATKRFSKDTPIDGMLLLGDNAYCCGTDAQYQGGFFDIYKNYFLYNTVVWPSPGNHDYADRSDWGLYNKPYYFSIFSIPSQGESGGLASNNPAYYSYDYGNTHFISLDSFGSEKGSRIWDTLSPQIQWLKKDLASTNKTWKIVYFHHPPYTKGSHDSDKEQDLIAIRTNLVKILEDYKVDLVLSGHSHTYERSNLLHRFYGSSPEFDIKKNALSTSNGNYDGAENSCVYSKSEQGLIAIVAGSAGWVGAESEGYPHKAMAYSNSKQTGALVLDIEDNRLDAKFINLNGEIADKFTIFKNLKSASNQEVSCGETVNLGASWLGEYRWSYDETSTKFLKTKPLIRDIEINVNDIFKCVSETFSIKVKAYPKISINPVEELLESSALNLKANFDGQGEVTWSGPNNFTANGKNVNLESVNLSNAGVYKAKASFNGCVSEAEIAVKVNPILGLEPIESDKIKVFPNPNFGEFSILYTLKNLTDIEIQLYDLNSKVLFTKKYKNQRPGDFQQTIKYATSDSILILKISSKEGVFYKKIIRRN